VRSLAFCASEEIGYFVDLFWVWASIVSEISSQFVVGRIQCVCLLLAEIVESFCWFWILLDRVRWWFPFDPSLPGFQPNFLYLFVLSLLRGVYFFPFLAEPLDPFWRIPACGE
jgi:hypothetical protein